MRAPRSFSVDGQPILHLHPTRQCNLHDQSNDGDVMSNVEVLIDEGIAVEMRLQEFADHEQEAGKRDTLREVVATYHAANKRAVSLFRSIGG
jgi:hypothetical protein